MCRGGWRDTASQVARCLSDQDIMRRYRMTVRLESSCGTRHPADALDSLYKRSKGTIRGAPVRPPAWIDPETLAVMETKLTCRAQTNKADYMSDVAFANLKQALEDAVAFEPGERRHLRAKQIQGSRRPKTSRKIAIHPKIRK
jgi:hypothetical protein